MGGRGVERCGEEEETGAATAEVGVERVVLPGRADDNCGGGGAVSATMRGTGVGQEGGLPRNRNGAKNKLGGGELPAPRSRRRLEYRTILAPCLLSPAQQLCGVCCACCLHLGTAYSASSRYVHLLSCLPTFTAALRDRPGLGLRAGDRLAGRLARSRSHHQSELHAHHARQIEWAATGRPVTRVFVRRHAAKALPLLTLGYFKLTLRSLS